MARPPRWHWLRDLRVTVDSPRSQKPSLVWTGFGFGLAWYDSRDGAVEVYFARLDTEGNRIGAAVRVTMGYVGSASASEPPPSLVWTGAEYGLAWRDLRGGSQAIYLGPLDEQGVKLGAEQRLTAGSSPSLTWTGSSYTAAWSRSQRVYIARFDA